MRPTDEPPKVDAASAPAAEAKPEVAPEAAVAEVPVAEAAGAEQATADAEAPEEDIKSKRVTLADLTAKGSALYAHKQYEDAAEVFSRASDLQAEVNGELAAENAEILFHYGRSLFKVGQSKSDVLGGTAAGAKANANGATASSKPSSSKPAASEAQKVTQEGVAIAAEKKDGEASTTDAKKPLFQFTGDENFDDSDEDEEEVCDPASMDRARDTLTLQQGDGEPEEEDDDLATAFEILDLARVCYNKQLEAFSQQDGPEKGKEASQGPSPVERHVKERLADTHDTLAEISLENER